MFMIIFNARCRVNAADVAEYFSYPRVISFLFEFCEKLFDISVKVSACDGVVSCDLSCLCSIGNNNQSFD